MTALSGHLALVTGATGGIGKATCLKLAAEGVNVAVHYHSAKATADELTRKLRDLGVQAESFQADLQDYDEVRKLHAAVEEKMGKVTILYSNAGTTLSKHRLSSIDQVSVDEFERTWRANCGSAFLLAQLCMPAMEAQGWGRVIFCSSVAGFTGGVVGPHYASSKSALHGLIHWMAGAYAKKGVTVNGVAPALIQDTAMLPGSNDELASKIPIGRLGKPDEIADTVLWMVKNSYVTNKVVAVDGGMFVQ
ncbi:uncharacterized protein PV09_04391 [Verruconis gallopava]|uniref:3-oxoacyl-[acyl-carrier-protein] reductase n=1 Tax=Verruconis gallopava TaxID=253628 RepID=A0A0D1XQ00_9PEZI|nr:uncharacterized protein PV09_04391 [Verruconis gallopava]KIW04646.1 hypothetical protein PV09_04391 [Verruconis gallopava]